MRVDINRKEENKIKNIVLMATSGGAGKDTVADYIVNELSNSKYVKRALGDPIHRLSEKYCRGKVERHHIQDVGEQMRKIFGEDVWMRDVDQFISESDKDVVIPDIRKLIEFAHYRTEKGYLPLYIKVDEDVAKKRLIERDGSYNEEDLQRGIESQMRFIESLPVEKVGDTGLMRTIGSSVFRDIYIVDNSSSLSNLKVQLNEWWRVING